MIRPILRAYIPAAAILCLFIGVLCLPDGSGLELADREPAGCSGPVQASREASSRSWSARSPCTG